MMDWWADTFNAAQAMAVRVHFAALAVCAGVGQSARERVCGHGLAVGRLAAADRHRAGVRTSAALASCPSGSPTVPPCAPTCSTPLLHRLGLFRVALFFALDPLSDRFFGALRVAGISTFQLDGIWPGVTDIPWVSLLVYLVIFDFVDYWIHRGQHHFEWWWRLHSLHHAQRQMTMWSDNRNHLLDDILRDSLLVVVAQAIGVAPGQFIAIVAITQLSESFQHANVAHLVRPLGRAPVDQSPVPSAAPQHRFRARNRAFGDARW